MRLASGGIIPPNEWHHSPKLRDDRRKTVAELLLNNNIEVP